MNKSATQERPPIYENKSIHKEKSQQKLMTKTKTPSKQKIEEIQHPSNMNSLEVQDSSTSFYKNQEG